MPGFIAVGGSIGIITCFEEDRSLLSGMYDHYTLSQNISLKSTPPENWILRSIGWSGTTLYGNLLPRTSQLTSGKTSWLAVHSLSEPDTLCLSEPGTPLASELGTLQLKPSILVLSVCQRLTLTLCVSLFARGWH